ncbi:MAG: ATP-binding protein [Bacteroidales bacterium]|jgi:energy-coupling factor transporter ATP-binding protein EcfA2|nr:ATP-binding protein [Bacteroidales bacterium]
MKIKRIQISNYRAFLVNGDKEENRYTIELPGGENLLIYGENGSGKSSLYKAIKDFFISALNPEQPFQKNMFYDETQNSERPYIHITLDDDTGHYFSSEAARTNTAATSVISEAGITKGFISYRDLLRLHFRSDNQTPDLFSFFLGENGLFSEMTVASPGKGSNKVAFRKLWERIRKTPDKEDLSDYNINAEAQFKELEEKASHLLKYFHKDCDLKISYTDGTITDDMLIPPVISFKVTLFGKELPEHDDILNEARLTSLAISVYLAHLFIIPDTDLNILFLDDIFIGLDMTNRIPLIKILTAPDLFGGKSFVRNYQIFLTTYDREWFNVAKTYLDDSWSKAEFYVDNHSCEKERPLIRKSDTYKERAEFHLIHGDYPACANYLRKAFEQMFFNILPGNMLHPGYDNSDIEMSQLIVSKSQLTIQENEEAWFFTPSGSAGSKSAVFRPAGLQKLIDQFDKLMVKYELIFPYIQDLNRIKNRLLNPLSHHDLKSPVFKEELLTGFSVLEELNKVNSKVIIEVSDDNPFFLFYEKEDYEGNKYRYKFQLLEGLRYLEYNGTKKLLNAECKPINRILISENKEEQILNDTKKSVYAMCKGACIYLAAPEDKKNVQLNESDILNEVYTQTGQTLNQLL